MGYTKQGWIDGPYGTNPLASPLTQTRFNHLETGIDALLQKPAVLPNDGDLLVWDAASGAARALVAPSYIEHPVQHQYQFRGRNPQSRGFPITVTDPRSVAGSTFDAAKRVAFPSLGKDGDALLCTVTEEPMYRYAAGYTPSTTWLKKSLDKGATWQTVSAVWQNNGRAAITVLANGDYLLCAGYTGTGYPPITGDPVDYNIAARISHDRGLTWGSEITVVATSEFGAGGSVPYFKTSPVQLDDGTILLTVYGNDATADPVHPTNTKSKLYASTDNGLTWAYRSTVMYIPTTMCYETTIQQMPSGDLVALNRDLGNLVRRTVSTDNGLTWSDPVSLWANTATRIDWIRLANGRSIAFYTAPRNPAYPKNDYTDMDQTPRSFIRYSDDDFVTYSAALQVHGDMGNAGQGDLIEIAPGICFLAYSEFEGSYGNSPDTYGTVIGRYLVDGQGVAPVGQNTYLPAVVQAGSHVVAYDTFNRPGSLKSLGTSESGQPWVEVMYAARSPGTWKVFRDSDGGFAGNSVSTGLKAVVLDAGVTDGVIEADCQWITPGTNVYDSQGVGLVARQNIATSRFLVAMLDVLDGVLVSKVYLVSNKYPMTGLPDWQLLHTSASLSFLVPATWYRAKLVVKGSRASFYLDDILVNDLATAYASYTGSYAFGTSWGLYGGASSVGKQHRFRNVVISSV